MQVGGNDIVNRDASTRKGSAAMELALMLSVLVPLFVIGVDFCRLYHDYLTITNCARNGAVWAGDPTAQVNSKYANVQQAALADATTLNPQPIVSTAGGSDSGGNYVDVTVSHNFTLFTTYLVSGPINLTRTVRARVAQTVPN
jgi:Flp pilus assembly protein TadG